MTATALLLPLAITVHNVGQSAAETGFSRLAWTSIIIGVLLVATRLPGILAPARVRENLLKFPRSVLWGRILIGIAAVWAAVNVYRAATDEWAWARPLVVIGLPVVYWLVITFANQFLAVRGAAALMLLVAKLMVDAADLSEHPLRLVVTVLGYVWVIAAAWMTIAPHHLRDAIEYVMANNTRCRIKCSLGAGLGVILIALGLLIY
jgi:hypothetical protein